MPWSGLLQFTLGVGAGLLLWLLGPTLDRLREYVRREPESLTPDAEAALVKQLRTHEIYLERTERYRGSSFNRLLYLLRLILGGMLAAIGALALRNVRVYPANDPSKSFCACIFPMVVASGIWVVALIESFNMTDAKLLERRNNLDKIIAALKARLAIKKGS